VGSTNQPEFVPCSYLKVRSLNTPMTSLISFSASSSWNTWFCARSSMHLICLSADNLYSKEAGQLAYDCDGIHPCTTSKQSAKLLYIWLFNHTLLLFLAFAYIITVPLSEFYSLTTSSYPWHPLISIVKYGQTCSREKVYSINQRASLV
jgi:hypothetical protein